MIDIHTHILPEVDDGSLGLDYSISMINECVKQGTTDIVLTPHYRKEYKVKVDELKEKFIEFKDCIDGKGLGVNLYLGQEIFIEKDYKTLFKDKDILTINGGKHVLIEFDYDIKRDVTEVVYELIRMGFTPIIAHIERYIYYDVPLATEVKDLGGLIQVNAESLVGKQKKFFGKKVKKLLKNDLVDFIASDYHFNRENYLEKAQAYVKKKFGEERAQKIFIENAKKIIEG